MCVQTECKVKCKRPAVLMTEPDCTLSHRFKPQRVGHKQIHLVKNVRTLCIRRFDEETPNICPLISGLTTHFFLWLLIHESER